ncbi:putative ankyrin repeat protein RBE_0997 [Tribolium madens]|uniref:putative ankyrin repeat protein RBE_0997 n=1 Tax=Tribolium madens TaxID=41895 RepID=UPI001CF72967|nr:putative ankyrin repeat protein RBE_0997 [Tribolium madens]
MASSKDQKMQLREALINNQVEEVKTIISNGYDLNSHLYQWTPLSYAITCKNFEIVALMLHHGANVNFESTHGYVPLYTSIDYNCSTDIIQLLISEGADINQLGKSFFNDKISTPLSRAIQNNNLQVAHLLVENGADAKKTNPDGTTAVTLAHDLNRENFIKENLENLDNLKGCTPLTAAILCGKLNDAKELLESGVNSCKTDSNKQTPLVTAVRCKNLDAVKLLLNYKANLTIPTAFLEAINLECTEIVKYLLEKGAKINKKYRDGSTPFIKAIETENLTIIEELLKNGAEVDLANTGGKTPLAVAANKRNIVVVNHLIEAGADINLARLELEEFASDDEDFDLYYQDLKEQNEQKLQDFHLGTHEAAD